MKLEKANLYVEYLTDMAENNGFVIKNEDDFGPVDIDRLINNPLFTANEYRCDCGMLTGADMVGQICPICKGEVLLHSLNFGYTGWIDLGKHVVITPRYWPVVKHYFGTNLLNLIMGNYKSIESIHYSDKDDGLSEKRKKKRGRPSADDLDTILEKVPKSRHHLKGLGLDGLYNNWDAIVEECLPNSMVEDKKTLKESRSGIFTSKIPIYSTAYRPATKTSETLFYPRINKPFSMMLSSAAKLDSMILEREVIDALNEIQKHYIEGSEHLISTELSKKTGCVRSEIVGGSFDFSARSVITLECNMRLDEVDLPYDMLVFVYQFKIAQKLCVRKHIPFEQAYLFARDQRYSPEIIDIVDEIIHREGPKWVMLLREPTINMGSIGIYKIRNYKMNDYTISITTEILAGMNADFDGDECDVQFLEPELVHMYAPFHMSQIYDYVNDKIHIENKEWIAITAGCITE